MVPPNLNHCDYATTMEFGTMVPQKKIDHQTPHGPFIIQDFSTREVLEWKTCEYNCVKNFAGDLLPWSAVLFPLSMQIVHVF